MGWPQVLAASRRWDMCFDRCAGLRGGATIMLRVA